MPGSGDNRQHTQKRDHPDWVFQVSMVKNITKTQDAANHAEAGSAPDNIRKVDPQRRRATRKTTRKYLHAVGSAGLGVPHRLTLTQLHGALQPPNNNTGGSWDFADCSSSWSTDEPANLVAFQWRQVEIATVSAATHIGQPSAIELRDNVQGGDRVIYRGGWQCSDLT